MIEINDLRFDYGAGDFCLDIPHLHVDEGERVAFVGPSGSGKTTLLNLIAGIARPQSGQIVTGTVDMSALDDAAIRDFRIANIGLVFQEFELLEYLNVFDNVLLPYRINNSLRLDTAVVQRAEELLISVGIGNKLDRHPDNLSQARCHEQRPCSGYPA